MLMFLSVATSLTEQSIRNRDSFMFKFKFVHADTKQFVKYKHFFFRFDIKSC